MCVNRLVQMVETGICLHAAGGRGTGHLENLEFAAGPQRPPLCPSRPTPGLGFHITGLAEAQAQVWQRRPRFSVSLDSSRPPCEVLRGPLGEGLASHPGRGLGAAGCPLHPQLWSVDPLTREPLLGRRFPSAPEPCSLSPPEPCSRRFSQAHLSPAL